MKTRFPSILGVFAAILMVASFVVPMNVAAPSPVSADPGVMKWDTVSTPGYVEGKNDIMNIHPQDPTPLLGYSQTGYGNEIIDQAVGNDGMTVYTIARAGIHVPASSVPANLVAVVGAGNIVAITNALFVSTNSGISNSLTKHNALFRNPDFGLSNLYFVATAPDDPKFIAVVADTGGGATNAGITAAIGGPRRIFVSSDGGSTWDMAFDGAIAGGFTGHITDIDVSVDYGGKRDIGVVTDTGEFWVRQSSGFSGWLEQAIPPGTVAGAFFYYALKFSPSYAGDSSVALVYADGANTYYNVALRDLSTLNNVVGWAWGTSIEVNTVTNLSPANTIINKCALQLPSDFSGQSASLRRAYISIDAHVASTGAGPGAGVDGIYRVDDTTVYTLMDTGATPWKSIYSIAYFGTYASGKLLAGERWGYPCTATVPTWFTDSPTTCPIPCWYPALKPTTGAANQGICDLTGHGIGAALVNWNADGSLGLVGTGSFAVYAGSTLGATWWYRPLAALPFETGIAGTSHIASGIVGGFMPASFGVLMPFNHPVLGLTTLGLLPIPNDESAFALSRNNGETWNQISLIDTTVDWFNDVAVAPDCTTIYLASANRNTGAAAFCNEFDSVWRATINPNVAAPLPAVPPLGTYWERVYCRVTSGNCGVAQTDLPILRLVNSCTDKKDGEIVGWAAQSATATAGGTNGVMAWSPDYGDYWANITPRFTVQDFAFESSTTLYVLRDSGLVQRLPYTGTSWSTNLNSYDTVVGSSHTIVAVPDGKVLVGGAVNSNSEFPGAYSADKAVTWTQFTDAIISHGNMHVIFDVDFKNNSFFYMGDDDANGAGLGTVYRNTAPSATRWVDNDMMSAGNGAYYNFANVVFFVAPAVAPLNWPFGNTPPHIVGQFGLAQAWTGEPEPALYSAHAEMLDGNSFWINVGGLTDRINSGVCRTLRPRVGIPKPGIGWDCLDIFAPLNTSGVVFTLEPSSLKYCGCCTLDTNTTLYAIDDETGTASIISAGASAATPGWRFGRWNFHRMSALAGWDTAFPGYTPKLRQGMLWAYTDCLAKKGPILKSPADKFLVGADPVTGRNQQIDLAWEQLCLSTSYQLQIGKDAAFTLRINPALSNLNNITAVRGSLLLNMDAVNMTSPAAWIAPGALPEAGAIYYWRIRSARSATSQIAASPWSEVRSFTVKAGFIVNTPYYGVQLLAPNNGCIGCKVKPASFSWSPWKEATKYQFDLAKDPEFKTLVVTATTTTTGYEYGGTLDYSTNYFWRVKALEVNGLNIPSDWSATFSMQTEPAPAPPAPPPAEPATPVWVWVIIAIGAILVIVTLVLIFKTRRV